MNIVEITDQGKMNEIREAFSTAVGIKNFVDRLMWDILIKIQTMLEFDNDNKYWQVLLDDLSEPFHPKCILANTNIYYCKDGNDEHEDYYVATVGDYGDIEHLKMQNFAIRALVLENKDNYKFINNHFMVYEFIMSNISIIINFLIYYKNELQKMITEADSESRYNYSVELFITKSYRQINDIDNLIKNIYPIVIKDVKKIQFLEGNNNGISW